MPRGDPPSYPWEVSPRGFSAPPSPSGQDPTRLYIPCCLVDPPNPGSLLSSDYNYTCLLAILFAPFLRSDGCLMSSCVPLHLSPPPPSTLTFSQAAFSAKSHLFSQQKALLDFWCTAHSQLHWPKSEPGALVLKDCPVSWIGLPLKNKANV